MNEIRTGWSELRFSGFEYGTSVFIRVRTGQLGFRLRFRYTFLDYLVELYTFRAEAAVAITSNTVVPLI